MAEVTGDLGGQPIQLNNAATETTLKQLLAAMLAMVSAQTASGKGKGGKGGPDPKLIKELEKELERLAAASAKEREQLEKMTKAEKDALKAKQDLIEAEEKAKKKKEEEWKAIQNTSDKLAYLGNTVAGVATGMTNLLSTLANVGNSMEAAAASMNSIPIVGGVLAGVFGAVAGAAEKTYKSFQQAASVGANFGGSITEMVNSASAAGLTFDSFSGIIAKTGKDLALLGGSTDEGAKRLAALGKEIKGTPLAKELNRMGYSTEAINEGMVTYSAQLAKTGQLQGMTNAQLVASTGAYLKDLDALTKLTGKNKQELEAERNARLKDAQFRNIMSKMDVDSQKNLQNLMDSIPAEHQEGMKEIIATGTATSEAGKKALAFLPDSARNMMQLNQQIRTTGKMGADQAAQINRAYQNEVKNFTKSGVAENMALYGDEASKSFYVGAMDAAARSKDLGTVQAEQQKAELERKNKEAELAKKGLDPASMETYKNKLAETSNVFTMFLANSGLLDTMMVAFEKLTSFTMEYVVPAFQFMADNFGTIAMIAAPLIGLFALLQGAIFAHNVVQAMQTLGISASLAPLAAMAGAALAAAAPFLPLIAAVVAVGAIFYALRKGGWEFSSVIEALKDNMQRLWLTLQDWMDSLLEKIPNALGGISKEEAKKRKELRDETRKELDSKEKARDDRREEVKEARGYKEDEKKATKENAKVTQENTAAKKAEAEASKKTESATPTTAIDLSSPQKMFDSMVKRMQGKGSETSTAPGATSTAPVTGAGTPPPPNQDQAKNMELIKESLKKQGITDPKYIAATLGNVMKETGGKSISENLNYGKTDNSRIRQIFGSRAAGKSDAELDDIKKDPSKMGEMMYGKDTKMGQQMGNTEPGDGFKYRGRGFIQLTGKSNYAAASKAVYGDDRLVKDPDMVNQPQVAADVSAWYMKKGKSSMAKSMGIDENNMTQDQANLLATSQIAGKDVRKGGDYLKGEVMNKVTAYSSQMAGIAGAPSTTPTATTTPTTAAAVAAVTNKPTTSQTAAAQNTATQNAAAQSAQTTAVQTAQTTQRPTSTTPGTRQESPESLLSTLNNKMDTLIAITKKSIEINERQLSVQRNIAQSGDLYSAA
jgi:putative chitinase